MEQSNVCYVCKCVFEKSHFHYTEMCVSCGDRNWEKRQATADLSGYTALVTGGRIKIGYYTALKLLRAGAKVIITSRFEADAWRRFRNEKDYLSWKNRLEIFAADFRSLNHDEELIKMIHLNFKTIDIIINNAAQTVRKPPMFYRHLVQEFVASNCKADDDSGVIRSLFAPVSNMGIAVNAGPIDVAKLSQLMLLPEDKLWREEHFPNGKFDKDGQQEDRRSFNSWMMSLEDVSMIEFLEVMYINVIAPFRLTTGLKDLLKKSEKERPSFIVNVVAMEGNFYDPDKNYRHPHTNMAKAAINMMTRTAAGKYADDRIFMTSVDPGWITNEKPYPIGMDVGAHKNVMAIDEIDGAARICDPIFRAVNFGEYLKGLLLKNYTVYPW